MKIKTLILLALTMLTQETFAQTALEAELQNNYFLARNRFKKWFVTVGSEPGNSVPYETLIINSKQFGYPFDNTVILTKSGVDSIVSPQAWESLTPSQYRETSGLIMADNPLIMIGEYLSVLSTEYWLLKHYNKTETEEFIACKNEIYYCLQALDRLDGTAEPYFNKDKTASMNGFMRRDDSDWDKVKRINDYYGRWTGNKFGSIQNIGTNNISGPLPDTIITYKTDSTLTKISKWVKDTMMLRAYIDSNMVLRYDTFYSPIYKDTNVWLKSRDYQKFYRAGRKIADKNVVWEKRDNAPYELGSGLLRNEMSIDEFIGVFMGLKYVQKFVDHGEVVQPILQDSAKNLVNWTRSIAHRMMQHISKSTTDIKMYQPEDYVKEQILTCVKDKKGRDAFKKVKDGLSTPKDEGCPECEDHSVYSQYSWKLGEGSVFNPVLFKEGNYILTNPAADGRHVYRGPFAFPYGYPIEKAGEELASGNGVTRDYPGVSMNLDDEEKLLRYPLTPVETGVSLGGLPIMSILWAGNEVFNDKKRNGDMVLELHSRCAGSSIIGLDGTSVCLTGSVFRPKQPSYWEKAWNKLGDTAAVLHKMWLKYGNDAGSANVMAAKLAVITNTWSQKGFAEHAEACGFKLMSLQYDILNDKNTYYPKSYYQGLLQNFDCHGSSLSTWPFDRDALGGSHMRPSMRDKKIIDSGSFLAQTGYMLYYNLYRIAEIKWWGNSVNNYNDQSCPCYSAEAKLGLFLPPSAIEPRRKVLNSAPPWIIKTKYDSAQNQQKNLVKTKNANFSHDLIHVRQPEYLNHYYRVNSNQILEVTRDLVICNATLLLNSGSTFLLDPPSFSESPNEIIVRNNGIIQVRNNAAITVSNNSRLVIDAGGQLAYSPGARIILNGPNAVLYIKGKLDLAPGATFQIEGGPAGKGYVVWDCGDGSPHYGRATLQAGAGSKMVFKQNDYNKLALEVRGFSGMYLPHTLQSFTADSCRINLKEQALIVSNAQFARFKDADVYGHNEAHRNPEFNFKPSSRGIQIWGRKNEFSNVAIRDCYEAIRLFNVGGDNQPLKLKNVKLVNNQVGVVNVGGSINWDGGEIIDANDYAGTPTQLRTGISGIGTHGVSLLKNVTMSVNDFYWMDASKVRFKAPANTAISNIWSHGPGRYYLTKCKAEYGRYGCIMNESFLFPLCSEFTENNTAIFLIKRSLMNAEGNAWNRFSWHPPDLDRQFIRGEDGVFIYLDQGKNYIKGYNNLNNNTFFMAHINQTQRLAPSDGISGFNTQAILARGNQWAIGGASHNLFTGLRPGNDACVSLAKISIRPSVSIKFIDLNYSPQYSGPNWDMDKNTACAAVNGPITNWPLDLGVSTTIKNNGKLGERVLFIADSLKKEFDRPLMNYPELIRKATDFLVLPFPTEVGGAVYELYSRLHATYPLTFTDTTILDKNRQTILAAVQREMNTLQDKLIHLADGSEPIMWTEFRYEVYRDKALIQRVFNQRSQALLHLNNKIPSFSRPEDVKGLQAWRCLIEKEQAWLDSLIPYWMVRFDTCLMNFDSMGNWDSTYSDHWTPDWIHHHRGGNLWGNNEGNAPPPQAPPVEQVNQTAFEISIRPNPTEGLIALSMTEEPQSIELMNIQGQRIMYVSKASPETELNISHLPNGVYFIRVLHPYGVKTLKIIKQSE